MAWLREEWGADKLGTLMGSRGDVEDAFFEVYGGSIAEAEARYLDQAPGTYAPLFGCDGLQIEDGALGFHEALALDCDDDDTFGGEGGLHVRRTVVIDQLAQYSIMTSGAWLTMHRCTEGAVAEIPSIEEQFSTDVPADYMGYPDPAFRHFSGGIVHDVGLVPGRYQLSVGIDGHEPGSASVSLWPSLAPQPVEP